MLCLLSTVTTLLTHRKRQREQEDAEVDKVKREKEWKHEWEVGLLLYICCVV